MATPVISASIPTTPILDQLSLWPHQQEAIQLMRRYIGRYQIGDTTGSALVHMPTGSGKTGVIAALARCLPEVGLTIILAPRIALRQQLSRDVGGRFFTHLENAPDLGTLPKRVIELTGDEGLPEIDDYDSTILVSTIQKIHSLAQTAPRWEQLAQCVSLVIIDEGHYEPAASWSLVLRSFMAPKIIFTATPYRNDLKIFDINLEHVFSYTYHRAVQDGFLREAEIVPCRPTENPSRFVDDLLAFYDKSFASDADPKPRVIIRCDQSDQIRQIAAVLKRRKRDYVAIHEAFSDDGEDAHERRSVPDPQLENATFWIHQFKLLEGIDDSRFQVLALFEPLQNARSLVQQIGRIIRNPGRKPGMKGYVLDHSGGQQWDLWLGFLKYDEALQVHGKDGLNLAIGEGWLASLFEAQPICTYLKDRFRTPLDFDQLDPRQDILFPKMVNLRRKRRNFDLQSLCQLIEKGFTEEDRIFRRYDEEGTVVFLYIAFSNSPILAESYFLEPKLGVTILRSIGDLIAYYDSSGNMPVDLYEAGIGKVVRSYELKKLFGSSARSHLTSVSLRNSNLAPNCIRSHSITAANIQDTVSAFDDHAQICTTATGYTAGGYGGAGSRGLRRYVGFHSGRVSDASQRCLLDDYEEWVRQVAHNLGRAGNPFPTFGRYAEEEARPPDPTPKHILLDLAEVQDHYLTVGGEGTPPGEPLQIEELSCDIAPDGKFELLSNGKTCHVWIEFDDDSARYVLKSPDLDSLYYSDEPADQRGLVRYLNQEQSFRVVPASDNYIFAQGEFFRPLIHFGPGFDPNRSDICQILTPSAVLANIGEEKGNVLPRRRSWPEDTLFGIIDRLGAPAGLQAHFGQPDIMVCDDMSTEAADFILAESPQRRVIFIHAKASAARHPFSASALQEVLSQATKNVNYLGMYNEAKPPNLNSWDGAWPNAAHPQIAHRIRRGPANSEQAWDQIRSVIRHPLANREVWLFLGQILSKTDFVARLRLPHPTPEAVQAAHLLRAGLTNVASVGAKLRVFCYP